VDVFQLCGLARISCAYEAPAAFQISGVFTIIGPQRTPPWDEPHGAQ
jgi:hypothetical protein